MREIKATVSIGLVGCKRNFTIKVDDDATDEDIDQEVHEYAVQNFIEASWTEADR